MASSISFAAGAVVPLIAIALAPALVRVAIVVTLLALAALGVTGIRLGGRARRAAVSELGQPRAAVHGPGRARVGSGLSQLDGWCAACTQWRRAVRDCVRERTQITQPGRRVTRGVAEGELRPAARLEYGGDACGARADLRPSRGVRRCAPAPDRVRVTGSVVATPIDFLRRFRFHVVPGAPAAVPAPADRAGELAAEVAPIFAALEATQRDAEATIRAAERDAAAVRASATEGGRRLIAAAQTGADASRDDAARRRLADGERERERVLADGRAEADRIARVAAARMPVLIDDVVRRVLAQAASAGGGRQA